MTSEKEIEKPRERHTPVQETKFPDDNPCHHEESDIDEIKGRLFQLTTTDPTNLDATRVTMKNAGATDTAEQTEDRPPSSGSEPTENEEPHMEPQHIEPLHMDDTEKEYLAAEKCDILTCGAQGMSLCHEHATDTHEHDEDILSKQKQIREQKERSSILSTSCSSSSASLAERRGTFANTRLSQDSFGICDECDLLRKAYNSPLSVALWEDVPKGNTAGNDYSQRCHRKFWSKFREKIGERCKNGDTADKNLRELLKRLLQVEGKEPVEEILYSNLVSCMRYFGPLLDEDGHSPFLAHLKEIASNSLTGKNNKLSWFAGRMSREEAKEKLEKERDKTYLIRMSTTGAESGSFVVSVKKEYIHHFEIKGNADEAVDSHPFSCNLHFAGHFFRYLTEVAEYLRSNPIIDETEEEGEQRLWCTYICPGLPFNSAIVKYKKAGQSKK